MPPPEEALSRPPSTLGLVATDMNDERAFWEQRAEAWERRIDAMNQFSDAYGERAMAALAAALGERIVDIGCGPGTTAIQLGAQVGPTGEVIALDIAEGMVDAARRRAGRDGATNVRAVRHDLEAAPIDGALDAAFSRFGVMFFPQPALAFANIAASLRPGGRLACTVWGELGDNPWMFVPTLASAGVLGAALALPGPGDPGPFSLCDPRVCTDLLAGAGFADIAIVPVASSRSISAAHANDEVAALLEVGPVGEAYGQADETTRGLAVDAVIEAIEPFRDGDGWTLAGSAFVVTAVRPS